jgi:DNA-binding NarL/FixJ family response regulator
VVDPKLVEALLAARSRTERSPLAQLTPRERQILAAVAEGKSNAAISGEMVLTKRAVEKHIQCDLLEAQPVTRAACAGHQPASQGDTALPRRRDVGRR